MSAVVATAPVAASSLAGRFQHDGSHTPFVPNMPRKLRLSRADAPRRAAAATRARPAAVAVASATPPAPATKPEDKWVARSLEAMAAPTDVPRALSNLQQSCQVAAQSLRMPTTRAEEYRFTDVSPLLQSSLAAPAPADPAAVGAALEAHGLKEEAAAVVVVVDGVVSRQHSSLGGLPAGAFVGSLADAPQAVVQVSLGAQSRGRGAPFATFNGCVARDVAVVHLPANTTATQPIYILYLSSSAAAAAASSSSSSGGGSSNGTSAAASAIPASAPRLLVVLEEGATAEVVEEFVPMAGRGGGGDVGSSSAPVFCNAVAEIELDDGAALKHSYVQLQGRRAFHLRSTLVSQGRESSYSLTEVALGGQLARHDLGVDQLGEATQTSMRSFLVCGEGQLQDLHSKLRLDHPAGEANQLHKCIVSHATGKGVFDGNVKVNRLAQKTDAQQLSRNLLLVPKATVNVKPNLQIIADDVKCTHGCTVSDLEEEELFYLRARGISTAVARQLLVNSFGGEVVQGLRDERLLARVDAAVKEALHVQDI